VGWTIEFDLPAGVTVSRYYYGVVTASGSHVTATNEYYNGATWWRACPAATVFHNTTVVATYCYTGS
jgi:hypothetical protein